MVTGSRQYRKSSFYRYTIESNLQTLDLEDSVHSSEKAKARDLIVENLKNV